MNRVFIWTVFLLVVLTASCQRKLPELGRNYFANAPVTTLPLEVDSTFMYQDFNFEGIQLADSADLLLLQLPELTDLYTEKVLLYKTYILGQANVQNHKALLLVSRLSNVPVDAYSRIFTLVLVNKARKVQASRIIGKYLVQFGSEEYVYSTLITEGLRVKNLVYRYDTYSNRALTDSITQYCTFKAGLVCQ